MPDDRTYEHMTTDQLMRFAQSEHAPTDPADRRILADELRRRKESVVSQRQAAVSSMQGSRSMRVVLYVAGFLAMLIGFLVFISAQSAIHEIEALILFLVGAVLVTGGAIIDAIFAALKASKESGQHSA